MTKPDLLASMITDLRSARAIIKLLKKKYPRMYELYLPHDIKIRILEEQQPGVVHTAIRDSTVQGIWLSSKR